MRTTLSLLSAVAASLLLVGCSSDDPAPVKTASIRVVHASPDAPAVDVFANGRAVVTNAPFKAATAFASLPAGPVNLVVKVAGTDTTVLSAQATLAPDSLTTVMAVNTAANLEPLVIAESPMAPATGNLKVRVVHAAPAVPAVDVYVTTPTAALDASTPVLAGVPFKGVSEALSVPAGDYRVRLTPSGTKNAAYDSGSVSLTAGADLVLAAVAQDRGASPVTLLGLTRQASTPSLEIADNRSLVRVTHASPDAPAVDVAVNGATALTNVPFPVSSEYLPVGSGSTRLQVKVAGTETTVIDATVPLTALKSYSVFAVNFVSGIEALLLEDDRSAPASGKARLRVIHGSPDAPAVDVAVNGAVAVPSLAFKAASGYLEVPAGTYGVEVRVAGTSTAVLSANLTLEAGAVYTVLAKGSVGTLPAQPLALKVLRDR